MRVGSGDLFESTLPSGKWVDVNQPVVVVFGNLSRRTRYAAGTASLGYLKQSSDLIAMALGALRSLCRLAFKTIYSRMFGLLVLTSSPFTCFPSSSGMFESRYARASRRCNERIAGLPRSLIVS